MSSIRDFSFKSDSEFFFPLPIGHQESPGLTVPVEFNRAAPTPDDYIEWCSAYANSNVDESRAALSFGYPVND
jgi:hypothetical protein